MLTIDDIFSKAKPILLEIPDVITAYLYGSYVDGTAREESDVDIAVDLAYDSPLTTFDLLNYQEELAEVLGKEVQLSILPRDKYFVFQHQVMTRGKMIIDSDPKVRLERLSMILEEYQDFKQMYRQHQKQEIKQFAKDIQQ